MRALSFLIVSCVLVGATAAAARDQIRIVGSSTLFPFATVVAEHFARDHGFATPVVESTGTGGGIKLFCSGIGQATPDIANASRRIEQSEIERCAANGVEGITEVKVGFDGIVLANAKEGPRYRLTLAQLWQALAKRVVVDGELVPNPYQRWAEIDPDLPDVPIRVYGPPPTSGTRDAFVELAMEPGCESFELIATLDEDARKAVCQTIREDRAYIESGENDNLIVQKLNGNRNALGIVGYSFLEQNQDILEGAVIEGAAPTFENIASGDYPISRSLFFYVKNAHVGVVAGIPEYVAEFTSERAIGENGYLAELGLIPLPPEQREQVREQARAAMAAAVPAGEAGAIGAPIPEKPAFTKGLHGVLAILLLAAVGYYLALRRAWQKADGRSANLHSRPGHYAWYVALMAALPALGLWLAWELLGGIVLDALVRAQLPPEVLAQPPEMLAFYFSDIHRLAEGLPPVREVDPAIWRAAASYARLDLLGSIAFFAAAVALSTVLGAIGLRRTRPEFAARNRVERWVTVALLGAAAISILVTAGIVFSVLFESLRFFERVPVLEFLFGLDWSPQTAIRPDQVGASGTFGAIPLFAGTLLITLIAMAVAGPLGLLSAIYLAEYATPRFRASAKPVLEILAGVPTVVYGFFAALTVAPLIRDAGQALGLDVASESALAAGAVMGIMIIPFVSSLSDDALGAVPQSLREASLGLGATQAETIRKVILPAALPGVIAGFLLAISRAIGETMIVVMAAGLAANLTANPLDAVTTVTVQIVTLLTGDQEFNSAKTLAAFALGLVLFVATLMLNVLALYVLKTYRERYD